MNEFLRKQKLQTVDEDALKKWIVDMNAGKWSDHGQISNDLYDV